MEAIEGESSAHVAAATVWSAAGDVAYKVQSTPLGVTSDTLQLAGTRGTNAGDLMNPKGEPLKTKAAAVAEQKRQGPGELIEVVGGCVVRKPTPMEGTKTKERQRACEAPAWAMCCAACSRRRRPKNPRGARQMAMRR